MDKPPLYKYKDFSELFQLGGKISKVLVEYATAGSILGIFYQIIVLWNLNLIEYFSWTQVINDTIVIGIHIFIVYHSYVRGLNLYEKYFYEKIGLKNFFYSQIAYIGILCLFGLIIKFLLVGVTIIENIAVLLLFGFSISFLHASYLHHKQQEHGLESKNFGDLSSRFSLLLVVLVFAVVQSFHEVTYQNLKVTINKETYSVKYMNDMYIITERGVFDRDGNRFYD